MLSALRKRKRFEEELEQRVGEVLHFGWDPIRIAGIPQARDEYDDYVPRVVAMLIEGKQEGEIAAYLIAVEGEKMGLPPAPMKAAEVASDLLEWCEFLREKHEVTL
jgi:hypothetical protein